MGSKRTAPPAPAEQRPIDQHGLRAALGLFVDGFVVANKRTQIAARLLGTERRAETLATLPRWLAGLTTPLAGADRSPAGLRARFGELVGVHLDEAGARRTTIAGALELGRARRALFIGDNGRIALLTHEETAPLLCARL